MEYEDDTVAPETTYHYAVLALSPDGDGAQSSTISATTPAEPTSEEQNDPPAAPTGLTAAQVAHDSLTLTWDDPQDGTITGYRVLRGSSQDSLSTQRMTRKASARSTPTTQWRRRQPITMRSWP